MKHLVFILLLFPFLSISQQTYVPDDNFEAYLEANSMGNGIANDNYVTTANINTVDSLNIVGQGIFDLTGIEDFSSLLKLICGLNSLSSLDLSQNSGLQFLDCSNNQLTTLNFSSNSALSYLNCDFNLLTSINVLQNTALEYFTCKSNSLTFLDVTANTNLYYLYCGENYLTDIDVSQNILLNFLYVHNNLLTSLDVSQNSLLYAMFCSNNQLECLNVKNGNNMSIFSFTAEYNPGLYCIEVDDVVWSTSNWTFIDAQSSFSTNCNNACSVGLDELSNANHNKKLVKIIDQMGRETEVKPNTTLIYIYSDGTTEKVYRME